MTPEQIQFQVFSPPSLYEDVTYFWTTNYFDISGIPLSFTTSAEHIGIIHSTTSEINPHILEKITVHKKVLCAILAAGLARRHPGDPAASLRKENMYGLPVLLSGLTVSIFWSQKRRLFPNPAKPPEAVPKYTRLFQTNL